MQTESHRTSIVIDSKDIQFTYYCSDEDVNLKGEKVWLYVESDELNTAYLRNQINKEMIDDQTKLKQEAETMIRQYLEKPGK